MRGFGVPIVFDVTHSLQLPGGLGHATGGQPEYIEPLARAGVAAGVDAVFMEVHDHPENALSDGPNALPLERMESLLNILRELTVGRAPNSRRKLIPKHDLRFYEKILNPRAHQLFLLLELVVDLRTRGSARRMASNEFRHQCQCAAGRT